MELRHQLLSTYTYTYHAEQAYRGMVRGAPATIGINAVALKGVPHHRGDRAGCRRAVSVHANLSHWWASAPGIRHRDEAAGLAAS